MNLIDLYNSNKDVRDSDIPEKWRKSFTQFMMGRTCGGGTDEMGNFVFIYYYEDFRMW